MTRPIVRGNCIIYSTSRNYIWLNNQKKKKPTTCAENYYDIWSQKSSNNQNHFMKYACIAELLKNFKKIYLKNPKVLLWTKERKKMYFTCICREKRPQTMRITVIETPIIILKTTSITKFLLFCNKIIKLLRNWTIIFLFSFPFILICCFHCWIDQNASQIRCEKFS